jgi:MarR family transcriptional regulator, transcriptional regulator for hemolysin
VVWSIVEIEMLVLRHGLAPRPGRAPARRPRPPLTEDRWWADSFLAMYLPGPDEPLTKRLSFLGKELRESFQALLAEHGCTLPTWAVLTHAQATPGLSQIQLAARIGIEGPTLARHLDRLCTEGLVERRRDELDRRIVRIELTDVGAKRWAELKDVATTMEARLTRCMSDDQRSALSAAIDSIHRALEDPHAADRD